MVRADIAGMDEPVLDALGLLTRDHRLIAELFREFEVAGKQQLDPLARRICKMLRIHAQIKDEVFYPAAKRALSNSTLLDVAERDQVEARQSIMLLESLTSDDAAFSPAIQALAKEVTDQFSREEKELFPQLRQAKIDLVSIGLHLAERRDTLMEVLGLHADDEEAAVYPEENPAIALATAAREQRERESSGREK